MSLYMVVMALTGTTIQAKNVSMSSQYTKERKLLSSSQE